MTQTHTTDEARPILTVDAILLTIHEGTLKVLLHQRDKAPFKDYWALPGGYAHIDEDRDAEDALRRILAQKTGLEDIYFEQMKTYAGASRDPRGWSVSIAFLALVPYADIDLDDMAENAELTDVRYLDTLAFDHNVILDDALSRLRGKGAYSSLPAALVGDTFSLYELRKAYEVVLGKEINASAFRRKILKLDILELTGETVNAGVRPAEEYRLKSHETFNRDLGGI
jgi:ADP-ribose pyrophosphatase YjhB (NUDIX family)